MQARCRPVDVLSAYVCGAASAPRAAAGAITSPRTGPPRAHAVPKRLLDRRDPTTCGRLDHQPPQRPRACALQAARDIRRLPARSWRGGADEPKDAPGVGTRVAVRA